MFRLMGVQPVYWLRKIWSPELFQGRYKTRNYFEGWYYKLISADHNHIYAVIPGIALGSEPADAQSFIQVINGSTGRTGFFRYPLSAFKSDQRRFAIAIGENSFSQEAISLNLAGVNRPQWGTSRRIRHVSRTSAMVDAGWWVIR